MKRGKKYQEAASKIEADKMYTLEEAVALVPQTATTKFDATVEVHVKLGIDAKKGDQQVRGTVTLPNSFGKAKRIAVFANQEADQKAAKDAGAALVGGPELVKEIKQSGKVEFDVAIATPDMMKDLAVIAKVLGPKGLMPSPKAETVTPDVVKAIEELGKGKAGFKNDSGSNVHMAVGKASMTPEQLTQNVQSFIDAIKAAKPESSKGSYFINASIATSMGPGIPFKV